MMTGKEKVESHERLDQMELKVLRSLKVSEEEIEAVAGAPDLYDRVRSRIGAGPRQQRGEGPSVGRKRRFVTSQLNVRGPFLWTVAAVAVVLLLAAMLLLWRPGRSAEPNNLGQSAPQHAPSAPEKEIERTAPPGKPESAEHRIAKSGAPRDPSRVASRRRVRSRSTEVATQFFPLTFIADSAVLETGQVVRVRIPRSALVSLGVPMNVYRAGELVKADVVIGDDGLARAIRFIQ